jgi:tetratricopeptide (TPR) repeat protein
MTGRRTEGGLGAARQAASRKSLSVRIRLSCQAIKRRGHKFNAQKPDAGSSASCRRQDLGYARSNVSEKLDLGAQKRRRSSDRAAKTFNFRATCDTFEKIRRRPPGRHHQQRTGEFIEVMSSSIFYHTTAGQGNGPSRLGRWALAIVCAIVAAALLTFGIWNAAAPESLARLHGRFFGQPLAVSVLELAAGRQTLVLKPGSSTAVSPAAPLKVVRLQTNRWRNYDLRLYSPDFDVDRLNAGSESLQDILGEEAFESAKTTTIEVKEGLETRAAFRLEASFSALDWTLRGDAAVEIDAKIRYYRKALEAEPDSEPLRRKLAQALEDADRPAELAEFLENELRRDEAGPEAEALLTRLASLHRRLEDQEREAAVLEKLVALAERAGQPIEGYQTRLAVLYHDAEPLKAAAFYEALLEKTDDPQKRRSCLTELAALYRRTGSPEKEATALRRLLELVSPEQAPDVWTELVALREETADVPGQREAWAGLADALPDGPAKADAYKRLGYLWYEAENFDQAWDAYLAASRHDAGDPAVLLNLARLALKKNDRVGYRDHLEKALALDDRPAIRQELAQACERDGLKDQAAALWLTLAESRGDDSETASIRGEARAYLLGLLRPPEGEFSEEFEDRLYQYSTHPVEFYNLGVTRFKAKHWDQALKAFLKALELDEDARLTSDVRGYLLAVYQEKNQTGEMLNQAGLLYRDSPSRKDCRDMIVARRENDQDWSGLAKDALDWTRWHPGDPDNFRFLALGQKKSGQAAEAAKSLLKAAQLEPGKAASWLTAAEALEAVGDVSAAKAAYQKTIDLSPADEKAEAALLRLALDELARSHARGAN